MIEKRKCQNNERYNMKKNKLLQKQNGRYIHFKDLVKTSVESENKIKALEEKIL